MQGLKLAVKEELSASNAKEQVAELTRFHRIQGSSMLNEAAEHIRAQAAKAGLKGAKIDKFPADGKMRYWTYLSPVGWSVKSAELRMIAPEEELLARFEDIPQSLHTFSKGTPKDGVTGELVDVGAGTGPKDYEGKEVGGRFVLATGRAKAVHQEAVIKRGSAGVITDALIPSLPGVRESTDIPDAHSYQGIWPSAKDLDKMSFGFSLSKRQGDRLRGLLTSGKTVKLKAKVEASHFQGTEDVVTATIPGSTKAEEEVFLVAHYCHPKPGANDNASGSGLLLEIGRTITALVESGRVRKPARTIRFIWVPETLGTTAFLANRQEIWKRLVAGINLDMVGEDQKLCGSTLTLDRTPDSLPSYLNDLVQTVMDDTPHQFDAGTRHGTASTFRLAVTSFGGGSDHAEFNERTIRAPCVMLLQWPDLFYHTSMDTIDKVSEDSLRRVGWITAVSALEIANADDETAFRLADLVSSKGKERLASSGRKASDDLFETTAGKGPEEFAQVYRYHLDRMDHVAWREKEAIKSVTRLASNAALDGFIRERCEEMDGLCDAERARLKEVAGFIAGSRGLKMQEPPETDIERESKRLVPVKLFEGTLNGDLVKESLSEEEYKWHADVDDRVPGFYKKTMEMLNLSDGKRTVHQIAKMVSSEYDRTDVEVVLRYLRDLEKMKLVKFVSSPLAV